MTPKRILPKIDMQHARMKQVLSSVLALVAWGSMWMYGLGMVGTSAHMDPVAGSGLRGNHSDLYPRWLGARELLLHGRNPYSPEITSEIQRGYYGSEIDPSRTDGPKDPQRFAYPVYVAFFLAPTVSVDFSEVRVLFLWLFTALTVASILFFQLAIDLKFSRYGFLDKIFVFFAMRNKNIRGTSRSF